MSGRPTQARKESRKPRGHQAEEGGRRQLTLSLYGSASGCNSFSERNEIDRTEEGVEWGVEWGGGSDDGNSVRDGPQLDR